MEVSLHISAYSLTEACVLLLKRSCLSEVKCQAVGNIRLGFRLLQSEQMDTQCCSRDWGCLSLCPVCMGPLEWLHFWRFLTTD